MKQAEKIEYPETITQKQARDMIRDELMNNVELPGAIMIRKACRIVDGILAKHDQEIVGRGELFESTMDSLSQRYGVPQLIKEINGINAREGVFALGLSVDGYQMLVEGQECTNENEHVWLARAHNPVAAILLFTDEHEQYFSLEARRAQNNIARTLGSQEGIINDARTAAIALPSAPSPQAILGSSGSLEGMDSATRALKE